jgi:CubicO group peptidase (beta-lactamase class C family)
VAGGRSLAVLAVAVATLTAGLSVDAGASGALGRDSGPPTVTGASLRFSHPHQVLRPGDARSAGLTPHQVARIVPDVAAGLHPSPTLPRYAGASVLAAHRGVIVTDAAVGYAVLYADARPTRLPPDLRVQARPDTIWDLASLTKLFTSIVAVQLVERHLLDLDAPVARYLPEFGQHGKAAITVRELLTHTSGLQPDLPLWRDWHSRTERIAAVYAVAPISEPGTAYHYSDLNMITLGLLTERITGQPLDRLVASRITGPLGMVDTGYNPPAAKLDRIAATEYEPQQGRGMVRGSVHDENAWALGGVAGHAGLFSTTRDLAVLCQALLNGGRYAGHRILAPNSVRALLTNANTAFPDAAHGLGFELSQRWYMDALSSPVTAGHTGFTGTSLVLDPLSDSFVILLANRVHPSRNWGNDNGVRRAVARDLAMALPVSPPTGDRAWFAGRADNLDSRLTATLRAPVPDGGAWLRFDLWYDTEADRDIGYLEASEDFGMTWRQVPLRLRAPHHQWTTAGAFSGFEGRQWLAASARLPARTDLVRWRYTTDRSGLGRGVYVHDIRISAPGQVLFDRGDVARLIPDGWFRSTA